MTGSGLEAALPPDPADAQQGPPVRPGGPRLRERVTVVLLTYNCAHRLDVVLPRLAALGVEIVAVDNASADGTAEVVEEFARAQGALLVVHRLAANIGAAGRNVGAQLAATPYVAFCDDDGYYELDGLELACDLMDQHPPLALVNARILVGQDRRLDPISAEMQDSPLTDRHGLPGAVLLGFMGGAVIVRRSVYLAVGGYDPRFFLGGEEETVSFKIAKAGHQMRYVDDVVMHHLPSRANAADLHGYSMRNTLWNAWLHRPVSSATRWTLHTLLDRPKNRSYAIAVLNAVRGLPWVLRERRPMSRRIDADLRVLDERRFAERRRFLTFENWKPGDEDERVAPAPKRRPDATRI